MEGANATPPSQDERGGGQLCQPQETLMDLVALLQQLLGSVETLVDTLLDPNKTAAAAQVVTHLLK